MYSPLNQPPIQIHLSDDKKPQSATIHHSTCVRLVHKWENKLALTSKGQIFLDANTLEFHLTATSLVWPCFILA